MQTTKPMQTLTNLNIKPYQALLVQTAETLQTLQAMQIFQTMHTFQTMQTFNFAINLTPYEFDIRAEVKRICCSFNRIVHFNILPYDYSIYQ